MTLKEKLSTIDRTQTFFGQPVLQSINAFGVYELLLTNHKPDYVVEIGTGHGTLSLYFALWAYLNDKEFFTFDNLCEGNPDWIPTDKTSKLLNSVWANRFIGDVFEEPTKQKVEHFLSRGQCLLFCDGGNKRREVKEFAHLTLPGSIIIVHDWPKSCNRGDIPECLEFHPWHDQSIELGTKAAILMRRN